MTSINLLPKVKPVERLFIPLLVLVILFSISFAVLIAYWFVRTETQVVDSRAQVSQLEAQIKLLSKQQETDSVTKDYQVLHSEAKKLADARQDWLSVINQLTSVLPLNSRILSVGVTDDEKISLVLESFRMEDLANYIVLLDRSGKFSGVTASSINMKLFTKPTIVSQTIPPAIATIEPIPSALLNLGSNSTQENVKPVPTNNQAIQSSNESDKLLNELNTLLNKKLAEENNGVVLPSLTPVASPTPAGTGRITEQDLKEAQNKLDEMKKAQAIPTPKAEPVFTQPSIKATPTPLAEPSKAIPSVVLYESTITIQLKQNKVEK